MKRITITIAFVAIAAFSCKKKTKYCYWLGNSGTRLVYVWENSKPTADQIKKVTDTCSCTITLQEKCSSCKTDGSGNDFDCD